MRLAQFTPLLVLAMTLPSVAHAAHQEAYMVPMRDGTLLATDAYVPETGALPTVLIRTPYGKGGLDQVFIDLIVDTLGFTLVMQDTRGRGGSEGLDQVFYTDGWGEAQDGYDTVDWIVSQPWNNGAVGEMGASAMGIAAHLNGGAAHPGLKALHVGIAPTDFYHHAAYQGGSFREALIVDWLDGQDASYMLEEYQDHPFDDDFWAQLDIRDRMQEVVRLPIFHYGGFHDVFAEGTLAGFETMQPIHEAGEAGEQRLLMGPWTHLDAGAFSTRQGELEYPRESILPLGDASPINWFNQWLVGNHRVLRDANHYPVRFWIMGDPEIENSAGNQWAWASTWPVPATTRRLYLTAAGGLATEEPSQGDGPLTWIADPAAPVPTIGGRELTLPAGPRDQSPLMSGDDTLVFQTEPLADAWTVVGPMTAVLYISSDAPDTDLMVRLADGYPDGRSMLVSDGVQRARRRAGYTAEDESFLIEGQVTPIEVQIGSTAQVFDAGHRIQVIVSSSNHRRFKVAGNTDLPFWEEGAGQVATNNLYVDEPFSSQLQLPIPRRGAMRRFPQAPSPSRAEEARALIRFQQGQPVTDADMAALQQAADRKLFELTYGAAIDAMQ